MQIIEKSIEIEDQNWKIIITPDHELILAYSIPDQLSAWKSNPVWQSWNPNDISNLPEWSVDYTSVNTMLPVFKLITQLFNTISQLVQQWNIDFFYFQANTARKVGIYHQLSSRLIQQLGGIWKYQHAEDGWFYYYKDSV